MKKNWMKFVLYGFYGILLAALIILQWLTMHGDSLRLLANILTLFLACPVVILIFSEDTDSEQIVCHKKENLAKTTAEPTEDELPKSNAESKIRTMEEFYEWSKQWNLSAREQEVGWLIYRGYTNRQIAQELYIAETTVKKHAGHIYEKMGVSGRKDFFKQM